MVGRARWWEDLAERMNGRKPCSIWGGSAASCLSQWMCKWGAGTCDVQGPSCKPWCVNGGRGVWSKLYSWLTTLKVNRSSLRMVILLDYNVSHPVEWNCFKGKENNWCQLFLISQSVNQWWILPCCLEAQTATEDVKRSISFHCSWGILQAVCDHRTHNPIRNTALPQLGATSCLGHHMPRRGVLPSRLKFPWLLSCIMTFA